MTITEIALLHISDGVSPSHASFHAKLAEAKKVMQDHTGRVFYWMQQIEDPRNIYVIGEWDSLDHHMQGFIPSPENQKLLQLLKEEISVKWLVHIDAPHAGLPLPKNSKEKEEAVKNGRVYSIGRHIVKDGDESQFKKTFEDNKHYLQDYVTEGTIGGGWRVEKEYRSGYLQDFVSESADVNEIDSLWKAKDRLPEEFILWRPWKNVDQHYSFKHAAGSQDYALIRNSLYGADIKHAKIMDL